MEPNPEALAFIRETREKHGRFTDTRIAAMLEAYAVRQADALMSKMIADIGVSEPIIAISRESLICRLVKHVRSRGSPTLSNGAWALMLEAARQLARSSD